VTLVGFVGGFAGPHIKDYQLRDLSMIIISEKK
jgi:hypothetical protein